MKYTNGLTLSNEERGQLLLDIYGKEPDYSNSRHLGSKKRNQKIRGRK